MRNRCNAGCAGIDLSRRFGESAAHHRHESCRTCSVQPSAYGEMPGHASDARFDPASPYSALPSRPRGSGIPTRIR
jgi:hypothetical protein